MLAWSGLDASQQGVAPVVYTPGREGTLQSDVLAGARSFGRLAVPVSELRDIMAELAAGNPVLVFQNLGLSWFPQWHYAVAVGYDLGDGAITLNSGRNERLHTPLATFERTWARAGHWALVVTPADRLSATASEGAVMGAAAGLERARRPSEAATAYAAIANRWPASYLPWMGLGNVRYTLEEFAAAEQAYRRASDLRPEAPEGWNNLAYAVARQGRTGEAISLAERAVQKAGEKADRYRDSLVEIRQMDQTGRAQP